jgi:hypothetical protein
VLMGDDDGDRCATLNFDEIASSLGVKAKIP